MDVDAVNSLSSGEGKGSLSSRDGCSKCGGAHFQRDCCARKITGKQSSGKRQTEQVMAKERVTKTRGKSKGKSKGTKGAIQGAKGSHKGKTSKTGLSGLGKLEIRDKLGNSGNGTCFSRMHGLMTGSRLAGTKVGNKRTTLPHAHLHLEAWILVPGAVRNGLNGRR